MREGATILDNSNTVMASEKTSSMTETFEKVKEIETAHDATRIEVTALEQKRIRHAVRPQAKTTSGLRTNTTLSLTGICFQ